MKKEKINKIILSVILAAFGIAMMLPIAWMLSASFKFESEVFEMPMKWIPNYWNPNNYIKALTDAPYFAWYFNTIKVTIGVVLLTTIVSSLAGYGFAKLNFIGKNFIFMLFISTLMIPVQVRIIPQFMLFKALGLVNKHASVIWPWIYNGFAIFLMRQFFMGIPDELIEAAKVDGSGEVRTFFQIVLPLAKAALVSLTVLSFTWGWNFYFGPLIYLDDINLQVLSVGIASLKGQYVDNYAIQMAGSTLALIPIITVYLLAQKQFVEGIALSGVKG